MNNLICQTAVSHILVSHTLAVATCSVNTSAFQFLNKPQLFFFGLETNALTISQNNKTVINYDLLF